MSTDTWAEIYDFHRDGCGNPTSHYTLWHKGHVIHVTKRRDQIGYSDDCAEHVIWRANKLLGGHHKVVSKRGNRSQDRMVVYLEDQDAQEKAETAAA